MSSWYGRRDETCPVGTGGGTRRVQLVRGEEGKGVRAATRAAGGECGMKIPPPLPFSLPLALLYGGHSGLGWSFCWSGLREDASVRGGAGRAARPRAWTGALFVTAVTASRVEMGALCFQL